MTCFYNNANQSVCHLSVVFSLFWLLSSLSEIPSFIRNTYIVLLFLSIFCSLACMLVLRVLQSMQYENNDFEGPSFFPAADFFQI